MMRSLRVSSNPRFDALDVKVYLYPDAQGRSQVGERVRGDVDRLGEVDHAPPRAPFEEGLFLFRADGLHTE